MPDELKELSDNMLADKLRETARRVKDGEAARIERGHLIDEAGRREWRQEDIAELADIKQQSVSKRLKKTLSNTTE